MDNELNASKSSNSSAVDPSNCSDEQIRKIPPTHPGEILRTEFMEPLGMSQNELARRLGVDPRRVNEIVNEKRSITADTALRLATLFDMTPDFWLGIQTRYELDVAEDKLEEVLREVQPLEEA